MKYNRFLPIIVPLFVLMLFEVFYFSPRMIYVVLVLINLFIFFTVRRFNQASDINKGWQNFVILPSLMSAVVIAYCTLLSSKLIIQSLFIFNIILLYLYLRYLYYYLVLPASYEAFSIENISSYGNFLTFFLAAATIYGLQSFLNTSIWLLMVIMLVVTGLIAYQVIWTNKIDLSQGLPYIFISCLIIAELFWSISFLPLNHNISGLALAICYYMLIGLVRHFLLDKLDKKKIKLYLGFGFTSLIVLLFTARWM